MKPRIKNGLIVGAIGLVLNILVSTAVGICGPMVSLIAGAVAGFLTARQERLGSKGEGAKAGAISGAVAGALVLVGQMLGAVGALMLIQQNGTPTAFGSAPAPNADMAAQMIYYLGGLGTGVCFGVVGIVMASLAAAGMAYLNTSENPQVIVNS